MYDHRASAGEDAMTELGSETKDDAAKTATAWKMSRGPIKVDRYTLEAAKAINALLTVPITVLPQAEGDIVRPFRLGIGADIEALLRPDAALKVLRNAVSRYAHSAGYFYALAQPDAQRHEFNGKAIAPVSEDDRINARQPFLLVQKKRQERRREREDQVPRDDQTTGSEA